MLEIVVAEEQKDRKNLVIVVVVAAVAFIEGKKDRINNLADRQVFCYSLLGVSVVAKD